ncbi:MAG: metalloregulator ArsR/SmtB family transcription factor [Proteobacteria bacterium]|jgi:DNA-binding transcriptional ArsR family regulator|nr:metalloregulator ArsR/SmtB family transcription factor [Pseudomonadota bacterium]
MPSRLIIAKELAEVFKVIAHVDRIRLIEELQRSEMGVNTLAETLSLPGSRVSQHLSLLRAHRIVEERRDGRYHLYKLIQPDIAQWIVDGIAFVEGRGNAVPKSKINAARRLWSAD